MIKESFKKKKKKSEDLLSICAEAYTFENTLINLMLIEWNENPWNKFHI